MNRFLDYLSRMGKSRGFGIQSPWAYSFLRDVIYEKWPYYGYKDIDEKYADRKERKRQKLYLRLRNFVHGRKLLIMDMRNLADDGMFTFFDDEEVGAIVIENPYYSETGEKALAHVKETETVGVTFDLKDIVIVFPRSEMYKQHYKMIF